MQLAFAATGRGRMFSLLVFFSYDFRFSVPDEWPSFPVVLAIFFFLFRPVPSGFFGVCRTPKSFYKKRAPSLSQSSAL